MSYVIKVTHEETLRRLTFENQPGAPGGLKFAELEAQVRELFELPAGTKLKLTYVDCDNDLVTMRNDVDLKDACVMQRLNPLRLKAVIPVQMQMEPVRQPLPKQAAKKQQASAASGSANQPAAAPAARDANQPIHHSVQCDSCGTTPIIGHRYQSKMRNNYDLCGNCLAKVGNRNGEFVLVDPPDAATQATLERMRQQKELADLQSMLYYNEAANSIAVEGARGVARLAGGYRDQRW
ncbi:hypothetical protein R1sor_008673 [Riccia sorocarpa]|uniref:PB1 domain-containing protein n=1 Tax=Riccia sorocarpa TaxID=122646 RepID=A0ABD3HXM5_9MARC